MSSFFDLVGYEYKKILKKKSVIIVMILAVLLTILSCGGVLIGDAYVEGKVFESAYESMSKDRAYARSLAGRSVESDLLLEAVEAYGKVPTQGEYYFSTDAYQTYARPYSSIRNIARRIYDDPIQNLTQEQVGDFYKIRSEKVADRIKGTNLNDHSKQKLLSLDEQIKKPFIYDYTEGYERFLVIMYTTGLLISFVVAICVAPLFSGEYTSGMDQLILASRHGKKKLILAKLLTGITLSSLVCMTLTGITYIQCMLTYGFDGAHAVFQLYMPMSPYPLTMGKLTFLLSISILCANILSTTIGMLLSARLKTPFGVISMMSVLIIGPMFVNIPETNVFLHNLLNLLPSNMMDFWRVTSSLLYEVFSLSVQPYIIMPIFAVIVTIMLLPFAYYGFKKHQIG